MFLGTEMFISVTSADLLLFIISWSYTQYQCATLQIFW